MRAKAASSCPEGWGSTASRSSPPRPVRFLGAGNFSDLLERVGRLARSHGLGLHAGLFVGAIGTLPESYRAALAAAENAVSRGIQLGEPSRAVERPKLTMVRLEQRICRAVGQEPGSMPAYLDRYLEALGLHYGHRFELVSARLGALFDRLSASLLDDGLLDDRGYQELQQEIESSLNAATTLNELFEGYRRAGVSLVKALERPTEAHKDRALGRALSFIHQHYAERLTLPQVARVAGFAPNYFSTLLKAREHVTFETYVQKLRIERAKMLLGTLTIEVQKVAQLSGFREPHYFSRVFRRVVGSTPGEYRRAQMKRPKTF